MAAEAAISFAVETLGNLLIQKAVFLQGVEEEVKWLKDELKRMQCFLKDAAEKQAKDQRVSNWVSEIREVAQDAEDAIEIFILKVENTRRSRGLLGRSVCFPTHVHHLNKVGKEIESIRKRLEAIDKSRERYGIQDLGERAEWRPNNVEWRRRLAPWEKDKDVVGLEEDVKLLLQNAILEENEGLSIATIVGMGGIGKSTLARKIYNHSAVADRFDCRAWVVVSSEFTPEDIIKQLILQLQSSEEDRQKVLDTMKKLQESTNDKLRLQEMLQEMLHKHLVGKRYFIVLDDVWEGTHWETLKSAFPDEQDKTSRLLFTSRNRVITESAKYVHEMKLLDPDKSWKLFLKKAFIDKTDVKCPEELEYIGRKILEKCGGLPLAISVIGGLLVKQTQSKSGWEKVLKEMKCRLDRSESNIVWAILELSYQNLPPELKACFLCLGFFKEDATIKAKKLVHMWIAQGLVPQEREETMEEIAKSYLYELINRNMVQIKDMSIDDQVKNCQIHDLIRELSITKAKEEISFEILIEEGNSQSSHKPRHRVMYCSRGRLIDSTNQNKHLRSLFVRGDVDRSPSSYWKSFELLRVLDFEGRTHRYRILSVSDAIGALIGLRYLGVRNIRFVKLPHSLVKLKNLQVLDLRGCEVVMPNILWKMNSLRHLYFFDILYGTRDLKIETLKNIRTLKYIRLSDWIMVEHPTQMTSLRELGIEIYPHLRYANKPITSLAMLENLVCLKLRNIHSTFLDQNRSITWFLSSASDFPPNLSYLSLIGTLLGEDPMPVLEKLPKLSYLKLDRAYTGREMVISHEGFPRLKVLRLRGLQELRNIQVIGGGAMPELKRLEIYRCPLALSTKNLPEHLRSAIALID